MNEDIKNVVAEALQEVLKEVKDNTLDFVESIVFPYVDEVINDFEMAQIEDAEKSASEWAKICAKLLNTGVSLAWMITKKVVTKVLENAADDEVKPEIQQ